MRLVFIEGDSSVSTAERMITARGRGGVASTIHLASLAGLEVLREGGNAFDAALATSAVLTALVPHLGDLGGDAFLLAKLESGELVAYNGSGRSPKEFDAEAYMREKPAHGPLTVTVPGIVDLWEWMHENFCSLDLARLLKPAQSLLENGFYPQEPLLRAIEKRRGELSRYESWRRTFGSIAPGSLVKFRSKAEIVGLLAKKGLREFYEGSVAERLVDELRAQGVPVGFEDFASHSGERFPRLLRAQIDDVELYELPPNTQGHTALQMLKTYEADPDVRGRERADALRVEKFFEIAMESYKYRDENLGDPLSMTKPFDALERELIIERKKRASRGSEGVGDADTTFFVTADGRGNLVGFIQSTFYHFGSGLVASEISFQARGACFAHAPGLPNSPAPRKRPLHTLSILAAERGDELYIIGCQGGHLRPQIHASLLIDIIYYGMDLQRSVFAPRYVIREWRNYEPTVIVLERGIDVEVRTNARVDRPLMSEETGVVHALHAKPNEVILVADPRASGVALPLW
ncbi:MAG: gamma-glutamyltransferase [Fervidicoccaceae archaeon]